MMVLIRRVATTVPVVLGITLVTFVTLHLFPADPARLLAGPGADEAQVRAIRRELGLDRPLPVQYVRYLGDLVTGHLGRSIQTGQPVADDLLRRLPATLELALATMVVYIALSLPLGVLAAITRGRWPDLLIRLVAVGGLAVPAFWLGFLLQLVLYRELGWFRQAVGRLAPSLAPPPFVTGFYLVDALLGGDLPAFRSATVQLVMPVTCLVLSRLGVGVKLTRTSLLEVIGSDYIRTARAKGLGERAVLARHALRNALMPVVTAFGIQLGYLLGGTLVVEVVFGWPGIGQYAIGSITAVDFPAIMSVTVVISVFFVLANLLVDLLYVYLDPRLRGT
ncbi:MAG: peptide ABC transporter permease [Candidatus Rokuibacteriota bacterium]|nr:MAG: peptide ABC transporter permease [Candidatus Rokubacteria bacterium]